MIYGKDKQYKAYIKVVNAASSFGAREFHVTTVREAMRLYASAGYSLSPLKGIVRAIVADDDEMMLLAVHRWRTASDNFSQEDHDASLAWRAKHDPVYIAYQAKHGNAHDVRWTLKGTGARND